MQSINLIDYSFTSQNTSTLQLNSGVQEEF